MRKSFAPELLGENVHLEPAAPGAGNDLSVTVPSTPDGGEMWILDYVRFVFTTSATAANRGMVLQTRNAANSLDLFFVTTLPTTLQTASQTITWHFYRNLPLREYPFENNSIRVWMPTITILPAERLKTTISNLQAGDTITNAFVCYRSYRVLN